MQARVILLRERKIQACGVLWMQLPNCYSILWRQISWSEKQMSTMWCRLPRIMKNHDKHYL